MLSTRSREHAGPSKEEAKQEASFESFEEGEGSESFGEEDSEGSDRFAVNPPAAAEGGPNVTVASALPRGYVSQKNGHMKFPNSIVMYEYE